MIINHISLPATIQSIVVGLSGGADSLCLTLLLNQWCLDNNCKLYACIVDHKLRPESSSEISPIIDILKNRKIQYEILVWKHSKLITGNVELKARIARYELLYKFCKEVNSKYLCIAHHALDQWETFFMRLSKGSGITGLTSMKSVTKYKDIYILRPLLKISPEDIKQTLISKFKITNYVIDPMNNDSKYERVKWRKQYGYLKPLKLDIMSVGETIAKLRQVEEYFDFTIRNLLPTIYKNRYLDLNAFRSLHIELQMRILKKIANTENIARYNSISIISYDLLQRMAYAINNDNFKAITFGGLIWKRSKSKIIIRKEVRKRKD